MADTTTVVVDKVEQDGAWHRVYFEGDPDAASTKDANLAKIAMSHRGQEVEVIAPKKGNYRYLNQIAGEREGRNGGSNGTKAAPARRGGSAPRNDDARQAQISAQWAVGRALEVFTLTDSSVALSGLTPEQKTFIEETARFVTSLKDTLAG